MTRDLKIWTTYFMTYSFYYIEHVHDKFKCRLFSDINKTLVYLHNMPICLNF